MGRASATVTVPGRAFETERLWYDPARWPSWVDGFAHVVRLDEELWPRAGAALVWDSPPGGRGRVLETVTALRAAHGPARSRSRTSACAARRPSLRAAPATTRR